MEYRQIYLSNGQFERTVGVDGKIDLLSLGVVFGLSLDANFEGTFSFEANGRFYVCPDVMSEELLSAGEYSLADLGDSFGFTYLSDNEYRFECRVLDEVLSVDEDPADLSVAYRVKGHGSGFDGCYEDIDLGFEGYDAYEVEDVVKSYELIDYEYDEEDEDDEGDDFGMDEYIESCRASLANLVFNDDFVNEVYGSLLKKMDFNEAYEVLCDIYVELMIKDLSDEEFDKCFMSELEKLM